MDRAYLKVKDLMTLYRVSDKTVRRWIAAGLPCLRFGYNILRFERAVAIHWIENYRVTKRIARLVENAESRERKSL